MSSEMPAKIQLPVLRSEDVVTAYAQRRPFRQGGNRLQTQLYNQKVIVHNYGHGGAGVSLAPGSAVEAVKIAQPHLSEGVDSIAVIGSGIVGLFTCRELLKCHPRLRLTIYAERFPVLSEKDNDKLITSSVAPGFWLPYHYGSNDPDLHRRLSTVSLQEYQRMSADEAFRDVLNPVEMIDITDKEYSDVYFKVLTNELKPTYREYTVTLNGKTTVQCRGFTTLRIDMQPFLHLLTSQLQTSGVRFVTAKLDSSNLESLTEKVIFNCAGLGSRELFGDGQMRGIKGHLVEFRNPSPDKFNYFLRANVGQQIINLYMHRKRIILGLTREDVEDSKVDPNVVQTLIRAAHQLHEKYALNPRPKL